MNFKSFAVGLAILAMQLRDVFGQPTYSISDVGTLGGNGSQANGISNNGQIVGESWTPGNSVEDAFLYGGGTMTNLGTLGGLGSQAYGINSNGQVVGYAYTAGNSAYHAFLYGNGTMTNLGTLGGSSSEAYGINSLAQVVGWAGTAAGATHAFLYSGGTMTDLGTLGGVSSAAMGINDNGQIAGEAATAGGAQQAFLYGGAMTNLGTLGGNYSQANGVNNSSQVVGWAYTAAGAQHAFLYTGGAMMDLGTLGGSSSQAFGMNNIGQVVGYAYTTGASQHAFIYGGGLMVDLNSLIPSALGWTLVEATGINDDGQIAGWGINSSNRQDAFLLTPLPLTSPPLITAQPVGQTNLVGATATFNVGVSGAATWPQLFSCQWQLTGTNLPAATNYSLVLTNLMLSQAGNLYDVVIANSFGSVTSSPAALDVRSVLITVNGQPAAPTMSAVAPAIVTISGGYPGGFIFYTLDGSTPTTSSTLYSGPITLTNSAVVQAMDLSEDFSESTDAVPVAVQITPVYALQTSVIGSGTVSANPASSPYPSNSVVILTANAAQHWAFDHWTGTVIGSQNPLSLTMDGPQSAQAVFVQTFPLAATTPGGGTVSLNGVVTSSPSFFPLGSTVTVAATASNGWSFMGWQGNASGTSNPLSFVMVQTNNNIQAIFGTVVGTNPVGGGSIVLSQPNPIPFGTTLTASVVPDAGNFFVTWSGAASGTNAPATIGVTNANPTINALFSGLPAGKYSLAVVVIGKGSVVVSPQQGYYSAGASVTLTATNAGTNFYGWTGAATGTNNPLLVVMNTNNVVQANFVKPASFSLRFCPALTISGAASQTYVLQSSTNIANTNLWVTLANLILSQPIQLWVDTNVDASSPFDSRYFYRASNSVNPASLALDFCPTLTISGAVGQTYAVQTSNATDTNLWVTLANVTLSQPVQVWVDTNAEVSSPFDSKYFYRIVPGQ